MHKFILNLSILTALFASVLNSHAEDATQPIKFDYSLPGFKKPLFSTLSLTNGDDGTGLRLNYSSLYSSRLQSDQVDCSHNESLPIAPQAVGLARSVVHISCSKIEEDETTLYSEENCKLMQSCAESKTNKDMSTFANYGTAPTMAAQDYAGLLMEDWLPQMEKLETLRKFSDKKYGAGFSASCKSQFDFKASEGSSSCDKSLVEKGFKALNTSCSMMSKGCYNLGADYGKNVGENESAIAQFFAQRTENRSTEALAADNEMLESVGSILAGQGRADEKVKAVFAKLRQLSSENKLDPVFNFDADEFISGELTKNRHYKFFQGLAGKKLTAAAVKSEIEKHRRNTAQEILREDCKNSWTYQDICRKATKVSSGERGLYLSKLKAASRLKNVDKEHVDLLKFLYPRGITTDEDAKIVLNASRCVALGVIPKKQYAFWDSPISLPPVDSSSSSSPDFSSIRKDSPSTGTTSTFVATNGGDKPTDLSEGKAENKMEEEDPVIKKEDSGSSLKIADDFKMATSPNGATTPSNYMQPAVMNNTSGVEAPAAVEAVESKKEEAPATRALNDKIADLTKKLNATEDHLARLTDQQDDEQPQVGAQKKREEDNTTIAELQKQITALKAESSAKASEVKASGTGQGQVESSRALVSSSGSPSVEIKSEEPMAVTADSPMGRGVASASSSSSSATVSTAVESAQSKGPSGFSTSGGSSGKPLLVLSKTDGLSAEKITETICEKIIELGGQSFEIEENGVKMEIIPEFKDGKILLDEKGKPKFQKVVKGQKLAQTHGGRGPASAADKADMKRKDEEALKRERAEYLKLKKLTNQAIQKKD